MNDEEKSTNSTPVSEPEATPTPAPTNSPTNGMAIAAFVTGLAAFILSWVPFLGFALGVTAVILGIIALKKNDQKPFSIIGIVGGGISVLISIFVTLFTILALIGGSALLSAEIQKQANEYEQSQQALVDAKKDFAVGETATFADFEVKANKVTRNYVPENEFLRAQEGKELIVVDLTAKNISSDTVYVSAYDFDVIANGVGVSASPVEVTPSFDSGDLQENASMNGNIVYEIPAGATGLKLKYVTYAGGDELTYTLALP